jgi:hypothetical protein
MWLLFLLIKRNGSEQDLIFQLGTDNFYFDIGIVSNAFGLI